MTAIRERLESPVISFSSVDQRENRQAEVYMLCSCVAQKAYDNRGRFREDMPGVRIVAEYEELPIGEVVHTRIRTDLVCVQRKIFRDGKVHSVSDIRDEYDGLPPDLGSSISAISGVDGLEEEMRVDVSCSYEAYRDNELPFSKQRHFAIYCSEGYVSALRDMYSHFNGMDEVPGRK